MTRSRWTWRERTAGSPGHRTHRLAVGASLVAGLLVAGTGNGSAALAAVRPADRSGVSQGTHGSNPRTAAEFRALLERARNVRTADQALAVVPAVALNRHPELRSYLRGPGLVLRGRGARIVQPTGAAALRLDAAAAPVHSGDTLPSRQGAGLGLRLQPPAQPRRQF